MKDKNEQKNIHATCVSINGNGILILGHSGAGKSDLALRLIENKNAVLVADDRVDLVSENQKLYACPPQNIKGLLEVRGVGIITVPYLKKSEIKLVVQLKQDRNEIERLPQEKYIQINTFELPLLYLYPFEISATDKLVIKLQAILDNFKK